MFTGGGGDKAAQASREASQLQADYQRQALDYLKQQERLPTAYREQALQQLGSLYGLPGAQAQIPQPTQATTGGLGMFGQAAQQVVMGAEGQQPAEIPTFPEWKRMVGGDAGTNTEADYANWVREQQLQQGQPGQAIQQPVQAAGIGGGIAQTGYAPLGRGEFVAGLREDPFYQDLLGAGEEAVLRGASATGGLRSGTASEALARNNQSILRGLYGERVAGLQGMAGLGSMAPQIAQTTAGIGQTLGQGQIAAAQAQQAGQQQGFGNLMGLGQLGLGIAGMFSDRKLKTNIVKIGERQGHNWYSWTWNKLANNLGLDGYCHGVMADEARDIKPEAVSTKHGYLFVDYAALGVM